MPGYATVHRCWGLAAPQTLVQTASPIQLMAAHPKPRRADLRLVLVSASSSGDWAARAYARDVAVINTEMVAAARLAKGAQQR